MGLGYTPSHAGETWRGRRGGAEQGTAGSWSARHDGRGCATPRSRSVLRDDATDHVVQVPGDWGYRHRNALAQDQTRTSLAERGARSLPLPFPINKISST